MTPRQILIDQYKRVSTFLYIFILLFLVFIIFKLYFEWAGITIIIQVYQYIFAFYLVYNFSRIDVEALRTTYRERSGWKGVFSLFIITRGIPFALIYITSIIFTLIDYLDKPDWPWRPMLNLLDGRFSNIVVYAIILLIILKLMRKPRITIPLFFVFSIVYLIIYELIYTFSPYGISITGLKIFQIFVIFFAIIFEFFFDRRKILKSIAAALLTSVFMYSTGMGIFYGFYSLSEFGSYSQAKSSTVLLRAGFNFPIKNLERIVAEDLQYDLMKELMFYSKKFDMDLDINRDEWERLLVSGTIDNVEIISGYLSFKNILLEYDPLITFAEKKSVEPDKMLLKADEFTRYASRYFAGNSSDIIQRFYSGNNVLKIWIIRMTGESGCHEALPLLRDSLSSIDTDISHEAYLYLKALTGLDPAAKHDGNVNDPAVISEFTEYYMRSGTDR